MIIYKIKGLTKHFFYVSQVPYRINHPVLLRAQGREKGGHGKSSSRLSLTWFQSQAGTDQGQTEVLDGQTEVLDGQTEVLDGQTGLMRSRATPATTDVVSHLSKARMWERFKALSRAQGGDLRAVLETYGGAKRSAQAYQNGKDAVRAHFRDRTGGQDGQKWIRRSGTAPGLEDF